MAWDDSRLTIDAMNAGGTYVVDVADGDGVIAYSCFTDEFEGLFVERSILFARFLRQGAIDARSIRRIQKA